MALMVILALIMSCCAISKAQSFPVPSIPPPYESWHVRTVEGIDRYYAQVSPTTWVGIDWQGYSTYEEVRREQTSIQLLSTIGESQLLFDFARGTIFGLDGLGSINQVFTSPLVETTELLRTNSEVTYGNAADKVEGPDLKHVSYDGGAFDDGGAFVQLSSTLWIQHDAKHESRTYHCFFN
mmetsp:Transcript_6316/g.8227  ORF Transcript_6316/g.8227 Transcript_6316/m.8227 type:complete len:181 (+) Transcript_6316:188-730(+)